jgi:hypothetical protein
MRLSGRSADALIGLLEPRRASLGPELTRALDELLAGNLDHRFTRRRPGRPQRGRVRIRRERVEELSDWVTLVRAARVLGVGRETVRRWAQGDPGLRIERRGPKKSMVQRAELIRFLFDTGRLLNAKSE